MMNSLNARFAAEAGETVRDAIESWDKFWRLVLLIFAGCAFYVGIRWLVPRQ